MNHPHRQAGGAAQRSPGNIPLDLAHPIRVSAPLRSAPNPACRVAARVLPRGFVIIDVVIGLAILAAIGAALVVALNRQQGAAARLAETRGLTWAAEQAMAELQSGRKPQVEGVRVEASPAEAAPPAGYAWVRVRAERNGRSATLVGLVPAEVAPPAEKVEGGAR
jgi:type II secretory pathway pseudopilin PulG